MVSPRLMTYLHSLTEQIRRYLHEGEYVKMAERLCLVISAERLTCLRSLALNEGGALRPDDFVFLALGHFHQLV